MSLAQLLGEFTPQADRLCPLAVKQRWNELKKATLTSSEPAVAASVNDCQDMFARTRNVTQANGVIELWCALARD